MNIGHIFSHSANNTGDVYIKTAIQKSFYNIFPDSYFTNFENRKIFTEKDIISMNQCDFLVLGGGGMLLRDTFPNEVSDYQWACSVELLEKIEVPLIVYAIGYNRFRNQEDFNRNVFDKHIKYLIDKSMFFSLRNTGSINAMKEYVTKTQHGKIRLNFCPTILYPQVIPDRKLESDKIGFLLAGDRLNNRHQDLPKFIENIKTLLKEISLHYDLYIIAHQPDDFWYTEELLNIPYKKISLIGKQPKDVIAFYSDIDCMIGDRGHSQMIPFGLGCKIISLISHDKLKWFLEDIGMIDYGVEENNDNLDKEVLSIIKRSNEEYQEKRIHSIRKISKIHFSNLNFIYEKIMSAL